MDHAARVGKTVILLAPPFATISPFMLERESHAITVKLLNEHARSVVPRVCCAALFPGGGLFFIVCVKENGCANVSGAKGAEHREGVLRRRRRRRNTIRLIAI